jgi:hypothetical protein
LTDSIGRTVEGVVIVITAPGVAGSSLGLGVGSGVPVDPGEPPLDPDEPLPEPDEPLPDPEEPPLEPDDPLPEEPFPECFFLDVLPELFGDVVEPLPPDVEPPEPDPVEVDPEEFDPEEFDPDEPAEPDPDEVDPEDPEEVDPDEPLPSLPVDVPDEFGSDGVGVGVGVGVVPPELCGAGAPLPSQRVSGIPRLGSTLMESDRLPASITSDFTCEAANVALVPSTVATTEVALLASSTLIVLV